MRIINSSNLTFKGNPVKLIADVGKNAGSCCILFMFFLTCFIGLGTGVFTICSKAMQYLIS